MARYTGPVCRLCRRSGTKLMLKGERCATFKCPLEKKAAPSRRRFGPRRKLSDRGMQLREKQKARYTYGILERQFRRFFARAERSPGITGDNLLQLLESRLDNVVYRLGFADSRSQARQIVRHGHITVNRHKVNIPSYLIKPGDIIAWKGKSQESELYRKILQDIEGKVIPGWLSLEGGNLSGRVLTLPTPSEIEAKFDVKVIVEYYSR